MPLKTQRNSGLIWVSDLAIASIGPRSLVATGPEEIVAAKWEFEADTERFLRAAEVRFSMQFEILQTKYQWIF